MRLIQYITESSNWKIPTPQDIKSDFAEYKAKEQKKWKQRAKLKGFRFPIFDDYEHLKQSILSAQVVDWNTIESQVPDNSDIDNIDDLRDLVTSYHRPRDIDRIIDGFENHQKLPYPIILKGSRGYYRLAGNTRTNTASILGIPIEVLVIDVSD